jgi:hypothetical protein
MPKVEEREAIEGEGDPFENSLEDAL